MAIRMVYGFGVNTGMLGGVRVAMLRLAAIEMAAALANVIISLQRSGSARSASRSPFGGKEMVDEIDDFRGG